MEAGVDDFIDIYIVIPGKNSIDSMLTGDILDLAT